MRTIATGLILALALLVGAFLTITGPDIERAKRQEVVVLEAAATR